MVIVAVSNGTTTHRISAETAAALLPVVDRLFGEGILTTPTGIVLSASPEPLTGTEDECQPYLWRPAFGTSAVLEEPDIARAKKRFPASSRLMAHLESPAPVNPSQVIRTAAVVVHPRYLATHNHAEHRALEVGSCVEVAAYQAKPGVGTCDMALVHTETSDTRHRVKGTVVLKSSCPDLMLIRLDEKEPDLEAAILEAMLYPGQPYMLLGQSTQGHGGDISMSLGRIVATELDSLCHVRGNTPPGPGDSGGAVFAVENGKLIAMCVGEDHHRQQSVLVPAALIAAALAEQ